MIDKLTGVVQEASRSRLSMLSHRDDIAIEALENPPIVLAHWMSIILLSGKSVRLTFKAHFMTNSARYFAAKAFNCKSEDVESSRVHDFFREFCNLTIGHVKAVLEANDVRAGVSLPTLARGFDEVFYPKTATAVVKSWRLKCEQEQVYCSVHIDILENFELEKCALGDSADSGDVDFL